MTKTNNVTKKALSAMKDTDKRMQVALLLGVSYSTICRWISPPHKNLALPATVSAIALATGIPESEILSE